MPDEGTTPDYLSITGVSRSFREGTTVSRVLNDVTIDVAHGECVALRGRSGSGKSTLLNIVCGIDRPDAGRVVIDGNEITQMRERERTLFRRRHLGFVYQAFNLVPTLSVADNVGLVLELNGQRGRAVRERVEALLQAVDLQDSGSRYPDTLSGGEQQRVAIARALAHEPQVILADEPTGNLDERSASMVLELLNSLVRERGGTMLIATHSAAVAGFCDRTLELRAGRIERVACR